MALPLYPPISINEVEIESKNLSEALVKLVKSLETVHFVTDKEYGEWGAFLLKAVDHNMTNINVALASEKLNSLKT